MPELFRQEATLQQIEDVDLLRNSNKVIVRIDNKIEEKKTDSGIWMIAKTDTDYNPATHTDRSGTVWRTPPSLRFDKSPFSTTWKTKVEIQDGDQVWFDYMNSQNCVVLDGEDGFEYKVLDYENMYMVKRENELIALNGYCMFTDYIPPAKSEFDISKGKPDKRFGIVRHLAEKNEEYQTSIFKDLIDIEVGDKVMFGARAHLYYIEEERYKLLDEMLRPVQRKNIVAVMDGDEIERLAPYQVMVKPEIERVTKFGIIMPPVLRSDKQHFKAEVIMSSHPEVEVGHWVHCPKSAPVKFNDYYILGEEEIYYTWKE